jgi:predicted HAD superfamily Cof-like phosphohydrolase
MKGIINRVINWNSKRYDQEFDHRLTRNLLKEETLEFEEATKDVDRLDALVDTIYVALGAMWKLGLNKKQIEAAILAVCDANDTKLANRTASHIKASIDKGVGFIPPETRLQEILNERR